MVHFKENNYFVILFKKAIAQHSNTTHFSLAIVLSSSCTSTLTNLPLKSSADIDIDTQVRWLNPNERFFFFFFCYKHIFFIQSLTWAGFQRDTTQRIYVPINTDLGRGQRSKVMGLRYNDHCTAGDSLYWNVILSAVWPQCYWPSPPLCCHRGAWRAKYKWDQTASENVSL